MNEQIYLIKQENIVVNFKQENMILGSYLPSPSSSSSLISCRGEKNRSGISCRSNSLILCLSSLWIATKTSTSFYLILGKTLWRWTKPQYEGACPPTHRPVASCGAVWGRRRPLWLTGPCTRNSGEGWTLPRSLCPVQTSVTEKTHSCKIQ